MLPNMGYTNTADDRYSASDLCACAAIDERALHAVELSCDLHDASEIAGCGYKPVYAAWRAAKRCLKDGCECMDFKAVRRLEMALEQLDNEEG